MKRILITGGAGFIGSHLCDYLINDNNVVVALDNLLLGKESNISHLNKKNNFKFYKEDILNYKNVSKIFKEENFDIVFHLAANSDIEKSHDDPMVDLNNTLMTTYNILNLMRENKVKQIIFASSSAIYGETKKSIDENFGPLIPLSHYGAAKLASESFISSYVENYDMQAWIARFPNVVGERATHGVIFDFINKLRENSNELLVLGDGEQCKPYLYVKDLIEALLFIWKKSSDKLNVFNIGTDSSTKVKDIASMVLKEMKVDAKINYKGGDRGWIGDVPAFNYDLTKIHELGWLEKYSSDEAVTLAIRNILKR